MQKQKQFIMTKTKKETPVTAVKNEDSEVTHSKEEMLDIIDDCITKAKTLREAVVKDEKPDITVLSFLCNENTDQVSVTAYGGGKEFVSLLVSICRRDEDIQRALLMAAIVV